MVYCLFLNALGPVSLKTIRPCPMVLVSIDRNNDGSKVKKICQSLRLRAPLPLNVRLPSGTEPPPVHTDLKICTNMHLIVFSFHRGQQLICLPVIHHATVSVIIAQI
jgi:hypothetical protein